MQISMYRASVPVLARALRNLATVLRKGEAHASARNVDPAVLLGYRLAPDMFALTRQVQIATDTAKGCVARLAGVDVPVYEDNETTFAQLLDRLERTVGFIEGFQPAQIDGTEDQAVTLKMRTGEMTFQGLPYLLEFVLPNVYFHSAAAYAILRHCGVELGKKDFLGAP
ncbi:MAG TPA: DUF1993 domain-containing protein [Steroidobacteraceae bacterium]|jgi:hypothetical protein|nr:DUF1993 domain-containing protein [Steroidobacteraceae bacterium]